MTDDGKSALFSTAQRRSGTLIVECERCLGRTRISYPELVRRMLPYNVWAPWRHHSRYLRCPACNKRSWVAANWFG
ncbi:MAG: hypothetical protein EXQ69_01375 [Acidimicrobiia bacterium]|nr:hypothetical protein [Acidimicrobiia bacterium]